MYSQHKFCIFLFTYVLGTTLLYLCTYIHISYVHMYVCVYVYTLSTFSLCQIQFVNTIALLRYMVIITRRSQERKVRVAEDKVRRARESKARLVYKTESLKLVCIYAYC